MTMHPLFFFFVIALEGPASSSSDGSDGTLDPDAAHKKREVVIYQVGVSDRILHPTTVHTAIHLNIRMMTPAHPVSFCKLIECQ